MRNLLDKDLRDESTEGLVGNTWAREDHPSLRAPLAHLLAQKRFEVPYVGGLEHAIFRSTQQRVSTIVYTVVPGCKNGMSLSGMMITKII